ncbi:tRNA (adenosine(37)-N6)-threonylcarbamoyltransferase complex ATPase subunit type 1 TsaE [Clostridium polynesiense]|uniref:tRNA (adenosine(37)-N6)-threonylcarbamoyltransferase complex ATPase subunit type 1 TsaE n=1 Tax=Clostridium polynesiense TaxID=1325933 RepID=UPI00058E2162|nr:tRNA (adenosine(37)-N6)-threonylcarbamoyltransferase complex ATPase subunit type 1 TsaE [Clostridium polynesiense]
MKITVNNLSETLDLGRKIGMLAKPGDIYCLDGDIGSGKTHLTKGIAEGLGIKENITSPTFTIVNEYHSGRLKLYHFDVYRVNDPDEIYAIGFDEYIFSDGITVIEWAEYIKELIPEDYVHIIIKKSESGNDDLREITITFQGSKYDYLKELEI